MDMISLAVMTKVQISYQKIIRQINHLKEMVHIKEQVDLVEEEMLEQVLVREMMIAMLVQLMSHQALSSLTSLS
jgi:hypothetical protein